MGQNLVLALSIILIWIPSAWGQSFAVREEAFSLGGVGRDIASEGIELETSVRAGHTLSQSMQNVLSAREGDNAPQQIQHKVPLIQEGSFVLNRRPDEIQNLQLVTREPDDDSANRLVELKSRLSSEQRERLFGVNGPTLDHPALIGEGGAFYLRKPGPSPYRLTDSPSAAQDIFKDILSQQEIARINSCNEGGQKRLRDRLYAKDDNKDGLPDFHKA